MTREGASRVLMILKTAYPKQYPHNLPDDQCRFFVDDLCRVFDKYEDMDVIQAYDEWHLESNLPPAVSTILGRLRSRNPVHVPDTDWILIKRKVQGYNEPLEFAYRKKELEDDSL